MLGFLITAGEPDSETRLAPLARETVNLFFDVTNPKRVRSCGPPERRFGVTWCGRTADGPDWTDCRLSALAGTVFGLRLKGGTARGSSSSRDANESLQGNLVRHAGSGPGGKPAMATSRGGRREWSSRGLAATSGGRDIGLGQYPGGEPSPGRRGRVVIGNDETRYGPDSGAKP